jgi:alkylated DNA repair dioxygenase AlkB
MAAAQITTPQILINTQSSRLWVIPIFTYEEPPIVVYGKPAKQHRDVDESAGYRYSGQMMASLPLSKAPIIQWLLPQINQALGTNFNGVLVNRYRNGEKYIGPR